MDYDQDGYADILTTNPQYQPGELYRNREGPLAQCVAQPFPTDAHLGVQAAHAEHERGRSAPARGPGLGFQGDRLPTPERPFATVPAER